MRSVVDCFQCGTGEMHLPHNLSIRHISTSLDFKLLDEPGTITPPAENLVGVTGFSVG